MVDDLMSTMAHQASQLFISGQFRTRDHKAKGAQSLRQAAKRYISILETEWL